MGEKVKPYHGRRKGFSFKGNKKQLSMIQSNMKKAFGRDVTVGKMTLLLNNFARVRWQVHYTSEM